jgi:hypothetical protein
MSFKMLESDFLLTQLYVPRRIESIVAALSKPQTSVSLHASHCITAFSNYLIIDASGCT